MDQTITAWDDAQLSNEELMAAFQQGDEPAFEQLYERHYRELTAFLKNRLPQGSSDEAEDLAETAFFRAIRHKADFDPARGSFRTWIYGIAANLRRDFLRSAAHRLRDWAARFEDDAARFTESDSHEDRWIERERLSAALAALTQRQRDVVLLTGWEGFSYAETAKILGIRPGSVGAHRSKALQRLRGLLTESDAAPAATTVLAKAPAPAGGTER